MRIASWFQRFSIMVKPLKRETEISIWSDADILAGHEWPSEIRGALDDASVAVLLVSANFLASDFIVDHELPYILKARKSRGLEVLWIPLSQSHFQATALSTIRAVSDPSRPLNGMAAHDYEKALKDLCDKIDEAVRRAETPVINKALNGCKLKREQRNLQVLSKAAKRETEVLIYSGDNKWHTQSRIAKGAMTCHCWIGDERTRKRKYF